MEVGADRADKECRGNSEEWIIVGHTRTVVAATHPYVESHCHATHAHLCACMHAIVCVACAAAAGDVCVSRVCVS